MWRNQIRQQVFIWKAAHTIHVKSSAQRAPSEETQERSDSTFPADVAPQRTAQSEEADSLLHTFPKIPVVPWDADYTNTGHIFWGFLAPHNWTTSASCLNQNLGFYFNSLADTATAFSLVLKVKVHQAG